MRADELRRRLDLPMVALREGLSRIDPLPGGRFALRDDLGGGVVGGGKVRKLEGLLAEARSGGGDVLTMGPAGGLHLLSAAVYGGQHGLRVHAVAWPQPHTETAERSLRALHAAADHVWPAAGREAALFTALRAGATLRALAGYPPQIWGPGGSGPVGTLGWVQAGLEIAEAVAEGRMPPPPRVWTPLGSGGTAAGLWVGFALAGLDTELVAVDITGFGRPLVQVQAARVRRLLARRGVPVPALGRLTVVAEPSAYGTPTAAAAAAARVAAESGMVLEPTYSAKTFAVALLGGPGCFVCTANGRPMESLLRSALPELPARLQRLLVRG